MPLGPAVALVAPWYNLVLVCVVISLFIKLFSYSKSRFAYIKPWNLLFAGILIFVVETLMTILRSLGYITFHPAIFPLFEMAMITLFIYMLLLQMQYVKTGKKD